MGWGVSENQSLQRAHAQGFHLCLEGRKLTASHHQELPFHGVLLIRKISFNHTNTHSLIFKSSTLEAGSSTPGAVTLAHKADEERHRIRLTAF